MAAPQTRNNAENKGFYKNDIFEGFVEWFALPHLEKIRLGLPDQNAFAKRYDIDKSTLSRWKQRSDFIEKTERVREQWFGGKISDVADAIYRSAMQKNVGSMRLFLEYTGEFNRLKRERKILSQGKQVIVTVNDIRFLIDQLPKDLQDKYYSFLTDLLSDVSAQNAGRLDDMSNSPNYDGL